MSDLSVPTIASSLLLFRGGYLEFAQGIHSGGANAAHQAVVPDSLIGVDSDSVLRRISYGASSILTLAWTRVRISS
jgi:hypothetical protein